MSRPSAVKTLLAATVLLGAFGPELVAPTPAGASEPQSAPALEQEVRHPAPTVRQSRSRSTPNRTRVRRSYPRRYRSHTTRSYRHSPYHRVYPHVVYTSPVFLPRVVIVDPAPPPIVVEPAPVAVATSQPVVAQPVAQPVATPVAEPEPTASFTIHFVGQNHSDTDLAFETIQGSDLLGLGGAVRFDVDRHWMIELGLDILGAENEGVEHFSLPLNISALAHFFPDSIIDPYALAGLGIVFNEYDDPEALGVEQYTQLEGHLGGGVEVNVGSILITADLRLLALQARPDRGAPVTESAPEGGTTPDSGVSVRAQTSYDDTEVVQDPADPDRMNTALQFTIGAGWRF